MRHSWPGNVRELRNVIRQAVLQCASPMIEPKQIQHLLKAHPTQASMMTSISVPVGVPLKEVADNAAAEAEKHAILEALRVTRGNKSQAARLLQVDYKTLHVKMKRYQLQADGAIPAPIAAEG